MRGVFVTGTGTSVGKTWVTAALAAATVQRRQKVAAIKPVETSCDPDPKDAMMLAEACGQQHLVHATGLYRAREPLAPYAIKKQGGPEILPLRSLVSRIRELGEGFDYLVVEGVGGALTPLDEKNTVADLASALQLPTIVVARDALGVLTYSLTAVEALHRRRVSVRGVLLNPIKRREGDQSGRTNRAVLEDYCPRVPIVQVPWVRKNSDLVSFARELMKTLRL